MFFKWIIHILLTNFSKNSFRGIKYICIFESGFGPEELPDWGGRHFRLLEKPQIAMLSHEGFNSYDVGVSWWSLYHLGIRHNDKHLY